MWRQISSGFIFSLLIANIISGVQEKWTYHALNRYYGINLPTMAANSQHWGVPWNKLAYIQEYIKSTQSDKSFVPYIHKLARKFKYDVVEKPRNKIKYVKEQLNTLSRVDSFPELKLTKEKLTKLLKVKNKKISDFASHLSRSLKIRVPTEYQDIDFSLLPSLDTVKKHVNNVMSQPEIIPSLAQTITKHVMGKQSTTSRKERLLPDKDVSKPTIQMINDAGFFGEDHQVITSDGYILTMHRIINLNRGSPYGKPVVFLQHGLLSSSADWIIGDRKKAFGISVIRRLVQKTST